MLVSRPHNAAHLKEHIMTKPALYQVHVCAANGEARAIVYRNGLCIVNARERGVSRAVKEARRCVRMARKCGGLR
jgi:hypothetical protein